MNLSKYCHIIWDWNGTLLNDIAQCVDVLNVMLANRNMGEMSCDTYRGIFDFPVKNFYCQLGFDFNSISFDDIADEFLTEYRKCLPLCRLQKNAVEILTAIKNLGCTQSILSTYQQNLLTEAVEYFNLKDYFVKLIGLNDYYAASKIDNGRRWIAQLDCPPRQILLVGDTVHDYEVATQTGIDCVLMDFGHQSREKLLTCDAEILSSLTQLTNACKNDT